MFRRRSNVSPYAWKSIATARPFPGVLLREDGRLQIGASIHTQQRGYDRGINGISVRKEPGEGEPYQLELAGMVKQYRFHEGAWQEAEEIQPKAARHPIQDRFFWFLSYVCFPIASGGALAALWLKRDAEAIVWLGAFLPAWSAALFANDFHYRWRIWRYGLSQHRSFLARAATNLWRTTLVNIPPLLGMAYFVSALAGPAPPQLTFDRALLASLIGAIPVMFVTLGGRASWAMQQQELAASRLPTSDRVTPAAAARRKQAQLVRDGSAQVIPWGGLLIPLSRSLAHFACVGVTRSGKTTIIRLLMQAVLPWLFATHLAVRGRAVVFDPKSEFVPILVGMGVPEDKILIMHPFDRRCRPWDIAADIRSKGDCEGLAAVLVPERNRENQFWIESVRDIVANVLWVLHLKWHQDWTFRHFMLVLADMSHVEQLLDQYEDIRSELRSP